MSRARSLLSVRWRPSRMCYDFPMTLSRPSRFFAALVTLFCLLFAQLAVAAYACPSLKTMPVAAMSGADMPGCQSMKMDRNGLCQAHCEVGQQSLDIPGTPCIAPFVAAELALVLVDATVATSTPLLLDGDLLARSTAPPLSIQNCCFRI